MTWQINGWKIIFLDAFYENNELGVHTYLSLHSYSGGELGASLYDRHYGSRIAYLPHNEAVSAVALSPADPHIMVTVSDDKKVKVRTFSL